MKHFGFICAAALAALMASCGNGTPKANLKSDLDTLSYAVGLAQTQGLKEYLVQRMGVDTTYIDEFIKGLNEGAKAGDDKKNAAYYAGIQIGQQVKQQMIKGLNYELFEDDSTKTVSVENFLAGFVAGTLEKEGLMSIEEASKLAQEKIDVVKEQHLMETYGENKKACEEFMAAIAKQENIKVLDNGVLYEVIQEGNGEIPTASDRVRVQYEGKLINDSIFDSSYERGDTAVFACNQVIPGWTNALTHMPVGSTWKVYIPQDQAYGERKAGEILPFSCLIFKIELVGIEEKK